MTSLASFLHSLALICMGVSSGPIQKDVTNVKNAEGWNVSSLWLEHHNGYLLTATSSKVIEDCRAKPDGFIEFPVVQIGSHEIYLDQKLIHRQGDLKGDSVEGFYIAPNISCAYVSGGKVLSWSTYSPARYFARIQSFPEVLPHRTYTNVFGRTINVIGFASVILTAIFSAIVFFGKIEISTVMLMVAYNLLFSCYFLFNTPGPFGVDISPLNANRFSDFSLWCATILFFLCLRDLGLISKFALRTVFAFVFPGMFVLLASLSNDTEQFGTSIAFVGVIIVFSIFARDSIKLLLMQRTYKAAIKFTCMSSLIVIVFNDILVTSGEINGFMLLPFGLVGASLYHAFTINDLIHRTYDERDHLRANLENEVQMKTQELREKTIVLEETMEELKVAQAEIVNSATLASLGTLSAGIAHEINNSLNYVNGSLVPLERILNNLDPDPNAKSKKLLGMMKEGLELTFNIIKSLRNYTGLNQAKHKSVALGQIVTDVLNIIKGKIPTNVNVLKTGDQELLIRGNIVGLNQVLMNLVTNAIDAMKDGGTLTIDISESNGFICLSVRDSGSGIPPHIKEKIFNPFFTTKEVGKGTGLGLHIVKKEVDRHNGRVEVYSVEGNGTEFKVYLPALHTKKIAA